MVVTENAGWEIPQSSDSRSDATGDGQSSKHQIFGNLYLWNASCLGTQHIHIHIRHCHSPRTSNPNDPSMARLLTAALFAFAPARIQSFTAFPPSRLYSISTTLQMTKRVLVPIADGSEEIETTCITDTLTRCGAQVTVASVMPNQLTCTMSRGIKVGLKERWNCHPHRQWMTKKLI